MPTPKKRIPTRQLTICCKTFDRIRNCCAEFPILSLCGKWLKDSGFKIGHVVDITCEEGRLTITLSKEQRYVSE